ncbi:MAG: hypothetical protein IRZ32_17605, partial [Solirubrobacteraceae bacterium]|nr:hypothetical protein [Solirubrobacteraceae bacterium]
VRERAAAVVGAGRGGPRPARALEEREQAVAEARAAFERARGPAEPG